MTGPTISAAQRRAFDALAEQVGLSDRAVHRAELAALVELAVAPLDLSDAEAYRARPCEAGALREPRLSEGGRPVSDAAPARQEQARQRGPRPSYRLRSRAGGGFDVQDSLGRRFVAHVRQADNALVASGGGEVIFRPTQDPRLHELVGAAARPVPAVPRAAPTVAESARAPAVRDPDGFDALLDGRKSSPLETLAAWTAGALDRLALVARRERDAELENGRLDRVAEALEKVATRPTDPVVVRPNVRVEVPPLPVPQVTVQPPDVHVDVHVPERREGARAVRVVYDDQGNKTYVSEPLEE